MPKDPEKQAERRRQGMRRMQLWWEFQASDEARELGALHAERLRAAFARWYAATYPDDAKREGELRSQRLAELTGELKKGRN